MLAKIGIVPQLGQVYLSQVTTNVLNPACQHCDVTDGRGRAKLRSNDGEETVMATHLMRCRYESETVALPRLIKGPTSSLNETNINLVDGKPNKQFIIGF